jgi:hypothetical protein
MNKKVRAFALLVAVSLLPSTSGVTALKAEEDSGGWRHGCWFVPPNPPACDICADSCNPYQKCCWIIAF